MPDENTKIQILHDHYKDSFSHLENHRKQRGRLLVYILILLSIMAFQLFSPIEFGQAISELIKDKIGTDATLNMSFVTSIIWFGLLALVVAYYQATAYIERQYKYIHSLEDELSTHFTSGVYTREGYAYKKNYPLFLKFVTQIYRLVFPIMLLSLTTVKIISELSNSSWDSILIFVNLALFALVLVSTLLYLLLVHFRK